MTDKAVTDYALDRPEEFLSKKAIERRQKQGLAIDSTDLPVCRKYVDAIRKKGVKIVTTGKWDNFVTVSCNDTTLIDKIAQLPFVRTTEKVWTAPDPEQPAMATKRDSLINTPLWMEEVYGPARRQIEISNGNKLHDAGFKGQGMTIAVIDAGFHNADSIAAMRNIRVLGVKDFVNPDADIYAESSHGMSVLSCIGMNQPHVMVGTAPEASFWLLRSEDEYSEHLVEQDYWAAALEFADSVGVDVVNTSLGYYAFDDSTFNYRYRDLDGRTSLMALSAAHAADKGMLVVCSAGNSGAGTWKKITPPADAENVITVGAIDRKGMNATFSSLGYTADGRVKPDVMAVGLRSSVVGTDGGVSFANGTSFASPIFCGLATCLWQACPWLSVRQLIEVIHQSGDRAQYPDNIFGYGVSDVWKAYHLGLKLKDKK